MTHFQTQKTIVFDFDGTLVNSKIFIKEISDALAQEFDLPIFSEKEIEQLRQKSLREIIRQLKIPVTRLPKVLKRINQEMRTRFDRLEFVEGILPVLKELSLKYQLGILTSNEQENVEQFLKRENVDFFKFIYSGASLFGKHRVMKKMLKQQALSKNNVIYVGDEVRDVLAARKTGLKMIAVGWGMNTKEAFSDLGLDKMLVNKPQHLVKLLV